MIAPCECNPDHRCHRHRRMLIRVKAEWQSGPTSMRAAIWSMQDAYGLTGFMPTREFDWELIEESSPEAIEAMFHAIQLIRDRR